MVALLAFALTLLVAVLVSELAHRSVLSAAVLFLVAGFLIGQSGFDAVSLQPGQPVIRVLAELALFSVLFTDGMRAGARDLASAWRLPGRALLFGMPLTLAGTALLAHLLAGLDWADAFLIGAILAPTDPVFAVAIVGREDVPWRLRHLLNVESGLNDGLALPIVLVMLDVAESEPTHVITVLGQLALGVALGIAIPWAAIRLERLRLFSAHARYQPLGAFAVGLIVLAVTSLTGANEFLAAFAAGATVATLSPEMREAFHVFGDLVAELFKLAALLVFGALISVSLLKDISAGGYVFALLALVLVRSASILVALFGSRIDRRELVAAAWFGPKGFASVVYGLLLLESGIPDSNHLFHLVAVVIVASILAHSSTDVVVARWFREEESPASGETA